MAGLDSFLSGFFGQLKKERDDAQEEEREARRLENNLRVQNKYQLELEASRRSASRTRSPAFKDKTGDYMVWVMDGNNNPVRVEKARDDEIRAAQTADADLTSAQAKAEVEAKDAANYDEDRRLKQDREKAEQRRADARLGMEGQRLRLDREKIDDDKAYRIADFASRLKGDGLPSLFVNEANAPNADLPRIFAKYSALSAQAAIEDAKNLSDRELVSMFNSLKDARTPEEREAKAALLKELTTRQAGKQPAMLRPRGSLDSLPYLNVGN